jgi:prevent-host-death family protein
MHQVTVHEAKTHLSRLLDEVLAGGEVIVARGKTPIAKIVALKPGKKKRVGGRDRGKVWIAPDFDAPLKEFEDAFYS